MRKKKFHVLVVILSWIVAAALFLGIAIAVGGLVEDGTHKDFALVLGSKVEEDSSPSKRLVARLDRAIELFDANACTFVIVSGGTGAEGNDEAAVMKRYLVESGVPSEHVVVDCGGSNTWNSAVNARRIATESGLTDPSIVAVSQYFHLARCRLSLKRVGFAEVSSSYARYMELRDLYSIGREIPAYLKYLLFRHTNPAPQKTGSGGSPYVIPLAGIASAKGL